MIRYTLLLKAFAVMALGIPGGLCKAQNEKPLIQKRISLTEYMQQVGRGNLGYIAAQFDVSIADAAIENAKVFPDPTLSISGYDNQEATLHLGRGYAANIGATIELGGKRKARINFAMSQAGLSRALLQDFLRNLRADACLAYFNALQLHLQYAALDSSAAMLQRLAIADSIRFKLGTIREIDARQSSLEARNMNNTLIQLMADHQAAQVQLNVYTGGMFSDTLLLPYGDFEQLSRSFSLAMLIDTALATRADIVAARQAKTIAENNLALTKANRTIDLGINAGYQIAGEATNDVAPTPAYHSFNAGVSIPLKLSNKYKGDLKVARYTIRQSEVSYEQALLKVETEVRQAYLNHNAAAMQVTQYRNGLLYESKKILEGKIYSYTRGETSLLDVLNAQRTFIEMQQNYYQSLYNYASTLIELERSAGIWDLAL